MSVGRNSIFVRRLSDELIEMALSYHVLNKDDISCWDCKRELVNPVAGECGHYRCFRCAKKNFICACGKVNQKQFAIDVTAQNIINQLNSGYMRQVQPKEILRPDQDILESIDARLLSPLALIHQKGLKTNAVLHPVDRFNRAKALIKVGRLIDAAPHLARVAAESRHLFNLAREALMDTIYLLNTTHRRFSLINELGQSLRNQCTESWVLRKDLQCTVCLEYFCRPVTINCGHTFCRKCINQMALHDLPCALCRNPIDMMDVMAMKESNLVTAVLQSIGSVQEDIVLERNEFFVLYGVGDALPKVRAVLHVTDPNDIRLVKTAIHTVRPYLAIVNDKENHGNGFGDGLTYGTVIIICDCTTRNDGSYELVGLGIYRFVVARESSIQGCNLVLAKPVMDEYCAWADTKAITKFSEITYRSAVTWYNKVNPKVRESIEKTYGGMPVYTLDLMSNGSHWLWWLMMVVPLSTSIKNQLLASNSVYKRLEIINCAIETFTRFPFPEDQLPITLQKVMNSKPRYIEIDSDEEYEDDENVLEEDSDE